MTISVGMPSSIRVSYGLIVRIPGPLHPARFIARPNRFLTVVDLNGTEVEAGWRVFNNSFEDSLASYPRQDWKCLE